MTTFYYKPTGYLTFDAMKIMAVNTLAPVKKQIGRCKANGQPVTGGMLDDMLAQVEAVETFINALEMIEEGGRKAVVRPARRITHQPGDDGYHLMPPGKE